MPKQKITKEMVVNAAFELARDGGMENVLVKNIANRLNCSVQPVYTYCNNMAGLQKDVTEKANDFVQKYISANIDKRNLFQSTGQAYIKLAKEEPGIFKIFILKQRENIASLNDLYQSEASPQIAGYIAEALGISIGQAKQLHINMLIYTIGIGTILSVTTPGIPAGEILSQQETAYNAFLKQVLDSKEDNHNE
ncbi:MAG: TetR/AcrR family transcriptional regulator [Lachnospiraceae bacterium]|nr:TetR/AcrR family transcriptional regulator [Lachnospiraceae bacterium]